MFCQAADNDCEEQVVQSMSVSVNKSRFNVHGIYNLDECLQDVKKRLLQRKHTVHIKSSDNSHRLEGCFCGIKEVREELQQMLKDTMKTKRMQDEIRSKENEQRMLTETKERQNISNRRLLTKTTHFISMDKDVYDYLSVNYYDELKGLCGGSIDYCETNVAIKVELDTAENVETVENSISALQNRFVVRKHKVPEGINFCKLKDEVMATQNKNNATTIFDSEQKTVKVIGSQKETDEIMQLILTLPVSEHFDGKDKILTKNVLETDNEVSDTHPDNNSTTKLETNRDEKKTLINNTELECPDKRGTTKGHAKHNMNTLTDGKNINDNTETAEDYKRKLTDDSKSYPDKKETPKEEAVGYDKKALTDDSKSYPDKKETPKEEAESKEAPTDDTSSEHEAKEVTTKDETSGDKNAQIDNSDNPEKQGPTTYQYDTKGDDGKTPIDDMNSEHGTKEVTVKDETSEDDKNAQINNNDNPVKQGPTTYHYDTKEVDNKTPNINLKHSTRKVTTSDETGGDYNIMLSDNAKSQSPDGKGTTTDDTTSDHSVNKGASKFCIKEGNAKDTMLGHDSREANEEVSNVKLDVCAKGKAANKDEEITIKKEVVKFFKTGNKSEYDYKSQGNHSPGAATAGSNPVQEPTKQRKLHHYISMDEDVYTYIQSVLHQEFEDLKALCDSVHELRDVEDSKVCLDFTVKNCEVEDETVKRRFQMLIDQVKTLKYKAPDSINASDLASVVHASAKAEATMIFLQSAKNYLKIVGRPDKVDRLKKHIDETISEQLLSLEQLSGDNMHTSEQPRKPQSGEQVYYHIPIDENLYTYISTHCQKEIERAAKYCTSITLTQTGSKFAIDFQLKDKSDEKHVRDIFKTLMCRFKSEECRVQKGIDFDGLASLVQEMNTSKEVMIFPNKDKQLLKLIGPNNKVSQTKKWIEYMISNAIQLEQLTKQKNYATNPNVNSSPITDQPQSGRQIRPFVYTSYHKANPVDHPRKPDERFKITSITSDSMVYESKRVKNKLTVRVHFANIIKQNTDVLVSYEDEWLQGLSVLGIAMKDAAGPDVEEELAKISKNHGPLHVGQVIHTSAGKLRPSVKYLVHAVRAKQSQYLPEDPNTFEILYKTFLNCLKCTNDRINQSSISIPPIGLREYGVQMVSAAFNQAVEEFDAIAEATPSRILLRSIHFISNDPMVMKQIITSIKSIIE